MEVGNVRGMIKGPLGRDEEHFLVKDMRNEGNSDFARCSFELPNKLVHLLKAVPIPLSHQGEDRLVWAFSPSGWKLWLHKNDMAFKEKQSN
ncbi:hypothetical protein SO802_032171 [Lithocarpus litseifolius]|uniref:Uncharacterized protein n=1 Tax=Lithocarpus litseifolius TaxID=425828 RepID=A0AAW2BQU5_9ROSI